MARIAKRSVVLSLRITNEEDARLKQIARWEDRSVAQIVRRALAQYSKVAEKKFG